MQLFEMIFDGRSTSNFKNKERGKIGTNSYNFEIETGVYLLEYHDNESVVNKNIYKYFNKVYAFINIAK